MKRSKTVIFILCAVLVLGGIGTGIYFGASRRSSLFSGWSGLSLLTYDDKSYTKDFFSGSGTVSADSVQELNLDWVSGSVKIQKSDDGQIHIREKVGQSLDSDKELQYQVKNGVLTILYCKPGRYTNHVLMQGKELLLLLPDKLLDVEVDLTSADMVIDSFEWSSFSFDSSSGSLKAPRLHADTIEADFTSGSCEIGGKAKSINISSSSGRVELNEITTDFLECDTTSGDCNVSGRAKTVVLSSSSGSIMANGLKADTFSCDSTSGDWTVSGELGEISGGSSSGKLSFDLNAPPKMVSLDNTSGGIRLSIPDNDGFTAVYSSTSGKFSSNFEGTTTDGIFIHKSGKLQYELNTSSGDIAVLKK